MADDNYVTQEELRLDPYSIIEEDVDDDYLEVLQDLTKEFIDRLCQQSFDKEGTVASPVEERISGTGKDTLFLPKRLVTLVKVRFYTSSTNYTEYVATEFVAKAMYITWNVYSDSIVSARLRIEDFPEGTYNVGVFGVWGWATVPTAIKYLQGMLIKKLVDDETFAEKMQSENIGDYKGVLPDDKGMITGDRQLDLIIRQYRSYKVYVI